MSSRPPCFLGELAFVLIQYDTGVCTVNDSRRVPGVRQMLSQTENTCRESILAFPIERIL